GAARAGGAAAVAGGPARPRRRDHPEGPPAAGQGGRDRAGRLRRGPGRPGGGRARDLPRRARRAGRGTARGAVPHGDADATEGAARELTTVRTRSSTTKLSATVRACGSPVTGCS